MNRGRRYVRLIARASLEVLSDAKVGWGNALNPEVSLLVCRGCGHVAWFLCDPKKTLEGITHYDRAASPTKAYR